MSVGAPAREPKQRRNARPAEAVAGLPMSAAMSSVVLIGLVRLIEFALVALIGVAVYAWYVDYRFDFYALAAIAGISVATAIAFQMAQTYSIQGPPLSRLRAPTGGPFARDLGRRVSSSASPRSSSSSSATSIPAVWDGSAGSCSAPLR